MTAHIKPTERRHCGDAAPARRPLRLAGLLSGLALLGGCAATSGNATTPDSAASAVYRCENGRHITARYFPPDAAEVTMDSHTIDMHIARSASGARYVGGGKVWWTKGSGPGSTGMLFTADAGQRIASCVQTGQ